MFPARNCRINRSRRPDKRRLKVPKQQPKRPFKTPLKPRPLPSNPDNEVIELTGKKKMNDTKRNHPAFIASLSCLALLLVAISVAAQDAKDPKDANTAKPATVNNGGRDPFTKFQPMIRTKGVVSVLIPPSIQERIERYRAMKMAAANTHVAAPKPTTALLLSETQVIGIFHTPRGWAAMVEATPIKLSYVIYPGESFFDGQLVAIEENRLIFRREVVWTNGRRDKTVEVKALRQPNATEAMTATKTPTNAPASAPQQQ
jgi:hypothetical protein